MAHGVDHEARTLEEAPSHQQVAAIHSEGNRLLPDAPLREGTQERVVQGHRRCDIEVGLTPLLIDGGRQFASEAIGGMLSASARRRLVTGHNGLRQGPAAEEGGEVFLLECTCGVIHQTLRARGIDSSDRALVRAWNDEVAHRGALALVLDEVRHPSRRHDALCQALSHHGVRAARRRAEQWIHLSDLLRDGARASEVHGRFRACSKHPALLLDRGGEVGCHGGVHTIRRQTLHEEEVVTEHVLSRICPRKNHDGHPHLNVPQHFPAKVEKV
mmetsp:Transcript_82436/g.176590  ORF Transcript_82436/g.176590 Transcript_82436/m.176590 type:complete len:272 (+) Transcript_82436:433-1248(+)